MSAYAANLLSGVGSRSGIWALGDQALVSGANFAAGVLLARGLGLQAFGAYVVVQVYLLYANSFQGALVVSPMLTEVPRASEVAIRRMLNGFFGYALIVCVATLVGVHLLAYVLGHWFDALALGELATPLAFLMVAFQLQDWLRRAFYVRSASREVLWSDVIAYGGQLIALLGLLHAGRLTPASALWAMTCSFGASAFLSMVVLRCWPDFRSTRDVLRANWRSSRDYLASWQLQWVASQGVILIGTGVIGTQAAGAIRAAQNLLGPLNVLFQWMDNVIPVRAALHQRDRQADSLSEYLARLRRIGLAGLFAFLLVLVLADDWLIVKLYGPEYLPFASLVVFQGAYYLFGYAYRFDSYYMRAMGETGILARASVVWALVSVAIAFAAVLPLAEQGIMTALVAGQAAAIVYLRAKRREATISRAGSALDAPRFVFVPRAGMKSWLSLPVGNARLSRSALEMYAPHRWTGRFYKRALGWLLPLATRLGLLGRRSLRELRLPGIEAVLELVPGSHASRIGVLTSGVGTRAKWTIKVMDENGAALAYARASAHDEAVAALLREGSLLRVVSTTAAASHAPAVLHQAPFEGQRGMVLVESAGPTMMLGAALSSRHFEFLAKLVTSRMVSDEQVLATLEGQFRMPKRDTLQRELIECALATLRSETGASMKVCIEHGDFAPWNLRGQPDGSVFAFDWEHGRQDGLPWLDALHFGFQTDSLVRHRSASQVLQNMRAVFSDSAAAHYARALGHTRHEPRSFILLYLLRVIALGSSEAAQANSRLQRFRLKVLELALRGESAC